MALTKVSEGGFKDDAASQAKIADEAVDEARLQVSNAGTNGQFLQKSSNTGGLTWADAASEGTEIKSTGESGTAKFLRVDGDGSCSWQVPPDNNTVYTHPNHSGEVTSSADGAQTIADNVVDEANLKVSNTPTNGQLLSAQSGNTGGLTWADPPASAPQLEATASGAITAGDRVIINANGTVSKVAESTVIKSAGDITHNGGAEIDGNNSYFGVMDYDQNLNVPIGAWIRNSGSTLRIWRSSYSSGTYSWSEVGTVTENVQLMGGLSYDVNRQKHLLVWCNASKTRARALTIPSSGNATQHTEVDVGNTNEDQGAACVYCDTHQKHVIVYQRSDAVYSKVATIASDGTITLSAEVTIDSSTVADNLSIAYDTSTDKVFVSFCNGDNTGHMIVGSISSGQISWGTSAQFALDGRQNSYTDFRDQKDYQNIIAAGGGKIFAFYRPDSNTSPYYAYGRCGTVSGTTISWGSPVALTDGSVNCTSCCYDSLTDRFFVIYRGAGTTYSQAKAISLSGTTISVYATLTQPGTGFSYVDVGSNAMGMIADTTNKTIVYLVQHASYGYIGIGSYSHSTSTTNLTEENYIGIAAASASDSATATIDISGAVNSNQSSLTAGQKYYVQNNGSLGLIAATPKVFAGTAVSATKLIVNDQQPIGPWTLLDSGTKTTSGAAIVGGSANFLAASCSGYNWFELHWTYHGTATTHFGINTSLDGSSWQTNNDNVIYVDGSYCDGDNTTEGNSRRSGDSGDPRLTDAFNSMQNYQGVTTFSFPHDTTRYKMMTTRFGGWNNTMAQYSIKMISGTAIHGNRENTNALTGIAFWNNAGYGNPVSWRLLGG